MSASEDPIRKHLTEARKAQILDAAAKVFAEKGFHRATTREIASAAGVSEGTIYNYFDSKDALIVEIMARLVELDALDGELMEAVRGDARGFFTATFQHRLGHMRQGQEMIRAILPEVMTNPPLGVRFYEQYVLRITEMMEPYVRAQIEAGRVRPVNVPLTVRAIQGMFVGLLVLRILGDEPLQQEWEQVPEIVATLIFDGLSPRSEE